MRSFHAVIMFGAARNKLTDKAWIAIFRTVHIGKRLVGVLLCRSFSDRPNSSISKKLKEAVRPEIDNDYLWIYF